VISVKLPANAETPSCGPGCVELYGGLPGTTLTNNASFIINSYKQGQATGTPITLFTASKTDPAQDFIVDGQGLVSAFKNLVSAAVAQACGNDAAYELQYSPFGSGRRPDRRSCWAGWC
jgi:hypothetical protein